MLLLVSVAGSAEVGEAVAGGADIVDVKNPAEGSLGAATPGVIRAVRSATPAALPVSAAIGDVPDLPGTVALAAAGAAACGVEYVKVGLLGANTRPSATAVLRAAVEAVRATGPAQVIATAFADGRQAGGLPPEHLVEVTASAGAHGCMLDTVRKGSGALFASLSETELARFVAECRDAGFLCALAGSLRLADMPAVRRLDPDIVGVRSAACAGDRVGGRVRAHLVRDLREALTQAAPHSPLPRPAGAREDPAPRR